MPFRMRIQMRLVGLTLFGLGLTACASQPQPVAQGQQGLFQHAYDASPATALAFDPPVLAGMPRMDLSRDDRGTAAFAGFQDATTTYYSVRTDDWYSDFSGGFGGRGAGFSSPDNYQRRAVSETYGVSYR